MKAILFQNPVGLCQRFVTIRLGAKWLEGLEEGEVLSLESPDGQSYGTARAVDVWNGDLAVVPASLLEMEHDPLCRTYSGLITGLRSVYRDDPIEPDTNVTVLVLDVLPERESLIAGA